MVFREVYIHLTRISFKGLREEKSWNGQRRFIYLSGVCLKNIKLKKYLFFKYIVN
jgi:hypothetical protein